MKVTPIGRKFGKYSPGEEFEMSDKTAKIFIKAKKLKQVVADEAGQPQAPAVESAPLAAPESQEPALVETQEEAVDEAVTDEANPAPEADVAVATEQQPAIPARRQYRRRDMQAKD